MAGTPLYFNTGAGRDPKTRFGISHAATRAHTTIEVYPGEEIGSVVRRAYGTFTTELADKLRRANAEIKGTINVPR